MWSTVEELEQRLGDQVRRIRLGRDATVEQTAERAGVSARTVQNLERGRGSTLATLVKVLRALDAEEWLTTLAEPDETISPMALLEGGRARPRQRASGSHRG